MSAISADVTVSGISVDTRHWINGRRVASADTFANHSPIDGSSLGEIHRGGATEVDAAVAAARDAFPEWAAIGPKARAGYLYALADLIETRVEELSQIETADNGTLLRWHRHGLMPRVAHNIRFFAEWALSELDHPDLMTGCHRNVVSWNPSGVAALITPWNAPLMLATWKIGPALAAGDTVVLKPAEWTPLSASYFADLMRGTGSA